MALVSPREKDPAEKGFYRACLRNAGRAAAQYVGKAFEFENRDEDPSLNWRGMESAHREQASVNEAITVAQKQIPLWDQECPAIGREKRLMMYPLFAAWIVTLSEDDELIEASLSEITQSLMHYRYEHLTYSAFFIAENIYYRLKAMGRL